MVATSKAAVDKATATDATWDGPTTGPKAAAGKTIVYVAQSMQNPGVAGVATGLEEAAKTIGWTLKTIDGQGTPAGRRRGQPHAHRNQRAAEQPR